MFRSFKKHINTLEIPTNPDRRTVIKGLGLLLASGTISCFSHSAQAMEPQARVLTVYFSHTGNTRSMAEQIQSIAGGDMLELQALQPYSTEHNSTVRRAEQERENAVHPQLATQFSSAMTDYDVIFVGYPIWAYSMPMLLHSFFDRFTFPGKTIVPFNTHMGSGLADGPEQIARRCPQATVLQGLAVRGPRAGKVRQEVDQWLHSLGLTAASQPDAKGL